MMKLLLLLDLDDTLLLNQMSTFLPAYLKYLSQFLRKYISPDKLIQTLLAATQKMVEKTTPSGTLEETFDRFFYPGIGICKIEIQPIIDQFYQEEFPKLRALTQPRPEAKKLVEETLQMGWDIAIATNPLFPRTATLQRLSWANLDHHQYPFKLISTYESFHFCKPHPGYYAEILAQLGWQYPYALMIGNEWDDDIIPAETMGLPTYWITDDIRSSPKIRHHASSQGAISGVFSWLQSFTTGLGNPLSFQTPSSLTAILKSTPAAVETLTKHSGSQVISKTAVANRYHPDEAVKPLIEIDNETSCKLIGVLKGKHDHNVSVLENAIPGTKTDTPQTEVNEILRSFFVSRVDLLHLLDKLAPEHWQKTIQHSVFGKEPIQKIVELIAANDRRVLRDIYQTIMAA